MRRSRAEPDTSKRRRFRGSPATSASPDTATRRSVRCAICTSAIPLELTTSDRIYRYLITKTFIVEPEDVYVLDPGDRPMLTLVTCYPFTFIGHAPHRYIIQAVLVDQSADGGRRPGKAGGLERQDNKAPWYSDPNDP